MAGRREGMSGRREESSTRRETTKDTRSANDGVGSLASVFRALADETRLHMLALLRATPELCVCDLAAVLDLTHSKAARHLRYLAVRGLVTESHRRTWAYYRWNADASDDAAAALRAVRPILLDERFAAIQNRLRARMASRSKDDAECAPAPRVSRTADPGAVGTKTRAKRSGSVVGSAKGRRS
ncbi:MAG: metalloregulator ArsR/SmtB family transcription factor [Deltaproteobacteria bacterium]|nr:metalloregulator ArsR/SmtB family transcription factor [Deltaproteobacteria bacterium]